MFSGFQAIEVFLVRSVSIVVSDRVDETGNANLGRHRWTSGGSGGPRSLRSIEVPTPTPTPPTPLLSSECPLSNSTNLRGPIAQRSVSIRSTHTYVLKAVNYVKKKKD